MRHALTPGLRRTLLTTALACACAAGNGRLAAPRAMTWRRFMRWVSRRLVQSTVIFRSRMICA
jgi:hypothetical protein